MNRASITNSDATGMVAVSVKTISGINPTAADLKTGGILGEADTSMSIGAFVLK